jgi:hypothetical protein
MLLGALLALVKRRPNLGSSRHVVPLCGGRPLLCASHIIGTTFAGILQAGAAGGGSLLQPFHL